MVNVPNIESITKLIKEFEAKKRPHQGGEVWSGRDLMEMFHYGSWQKFRSAIFRAVDAIRASELDPGDHITQADEMVEIGSGARRGRENFYMTRHGAYMLMQELKVSDTTLAAFAKTYFSGQTHVAETIQKNMAELDDRLKSRSELKKAEKSLSAVLWERGVPGPGIGKIRSEGDNALFGKPTRIMKRTVGVDLKKPLANKLHTIAIKAKELTAAMSAHNIEEKDLTAHYAMEAEHVDNNLAVRDALGKRGIIPENLPAGEDTEKLERKLGETKTIGAKKLKDAAPHLPTLSVDPKDSSGKRTNGEQTALPFDE